MPRIGIVGPTYPSLSLAADAERCVNWYPEPIESGAGKNRYALYNTPGYAPFVTLGNGPGRGLLTTNTGRCFAISGNILYEVAFNGAVTNRGTLALSTGMCTITQGQTQIFIVEGVAAGALTGHAWSFDLNSNTLTDVTALLVHEPLMGGYAEGFFVVLFRNTSEIQISAPLDATSWNGLDVFEVSSFPDHIVGMIIDHKEIWLGGTKATEILWLNGGADFPFTPSTQASIQHGWMAPFTAQRLDNTLFWLGINEQGRGVVYRASGYLPQRVSNYAAENALLQYARTHPGNDSLAGAFAYTYLEAGHSFYVLTVPGMETSWAYDVGTQMWHERGVWSGSAFTARTECVHAYGLDRHLYQNTQNGILAEGAITLGDDYGSGLQRMRRSPHQSDENLWQIHSDLQIQVDADPARSLNLRWSDDAVHTWGNTHTVAAGAASRFAAGQRIRYLRLGRTRDRVYELTCSDVNLLGDVALFADASGTVEMHHSSPAGTHSWWAEWTDFRIPTLPVGAVVTAIYPVIRGSYSSPDAAQSVVFSGTGGDPSRSLTLGASDGQVAGATIGADDSIIPDYSVLASITSSIGPVDIVATMTITAVGIAVYYTAAGHVDGSQGLLTPPVALGPGEGVAWSYPHAASHGRT